MRIALSLSVFLLSLLVGCKDPDEVLRAQIERDLWSSLAVGDPAEKIERVLKEKRMDFSFDEFAQRYQTGVDPNEKRMVQRVVSVWVYVDDSKRLTRIEVRNSYTFL